ncbi:hypothetical protein FZW96_12965 [Bacillus sp. BGMRC 2118]|nr:hypothetical protein FZW96_12965 [Bacillus sp. BGMRC 2118]
MNSSKNEQLHSIMIDRKENSILLTYLPMDSYVTIPTEDGDRKDKLAHAYTYGGSTTAVKAVSQFLELPIDYFVATDHERLASFIDSMELELGVLKNGKNVFESFKILEQQEGRKNTEKVKMDTLFQVVTNSYQKLSVNKTQQF